LVEGTRTDEKRSPDDAGPLVAALMAGATAVMWAQVPVRYLVAGTFDILNLLLPEKSGDVLEIWLISLLVGIVVFLVAYPLFRRRRKVASIRAWTAVLLVSALLRYI